MRVPSNWRLLLTLLFAAAALASGWSVWRMAHPASETVLHTRPDYVLRNFEIVVLGKQGQESFTLRGPELLRDPREKIMHLATPLFLVPDRQGRHWNVRAQRGSVPADGTSLELYGQVRADSPEGIPPPTRIETDRLTLDLQANLARTTAKVVITRPGLTMRGVGLKADFDHQQVSLLSQVRTHYVPQH